MISKEIKIHISGLTLTAKAWGSPDHKPVLALHGWLDNANSFDLLAPLLRDCYLIAIDFSGHGLSEHLPEASTYHFIDAVSHIYQIANFFGWEKFNLLGHSMGACIASLVAGTYPDQIEKLLLIEGLSPLFAEDNTAAQQLKDYLNKMRILKAYQKKVYGSIQEAAKIRAIKGYLDYQHALLLCQRGLQKTEEGYIWRHDNKLLAPSPLRLTEEQAISFLKRISAKTCLVIADKGFDYGHKVIENHSKLVEFIEIHQVPGGHHVHMEQPDKVANILNNFL